MKRCVFLSNSKRGMSEVIVTLLLVMLAIVLVGAVFIVINNLIRGGTQETASQFQCLSSSVDVLSFSCTQSGSECNITLKRTSGTDVLGGVRVLFSNENQDSNVSDFKGDIPFPATKKATARNIGVVNITNVSSIIYFVSSSGKIEACPVSSAGLAGSVGSTGTSAEGGSTGNSGNSGSTSGSTTTTNNQPGCTPPADATLAGICGSQQCGEIVNGSGTGCPTVTCGNQNYLSNQGCSLPYFCNSTYQCEAPKLVNTGTVTSVYPKNGTTIYFGGSNLPKNGTADQDYHDGKHYVRFPGSNEIDSQGRTNCTLISWVQCLTPDQCSADEGSSFVQMSPVSPEYYINISVGDQYDIWSTEYGCLNASGTL